MEPKQIARQLDEMSRKQNLELLELDYLMMQARDSKLEQEHKDELRKRAGRVLDAIQASAEGLRRMAQIAEERNEK